MGVAMQWNIWLLLAGALQAVLLSVLLLRRQSFRTGYVYLSLYLAVLLAQLLFKIASKVWLMATLPDAYSTSYHLPFLYGPLIWLFTTHVTQPQRFRLHQLLHFAPFVYAVVLDLFVDYSPRLEWLFIPIYGWTQAFLQLISIAFYHKLASNTWKKFNKGLKSHFSEVHVIRMIWVRKFIVASFFVCSAISLLTAFIYVTYPAYSFFRFGFLLLTGFVYWISYSALHQPQLFAAFLNKSNPSPVKTPLIPPLVVRKSPVKYASSNLTPQEAGRIGDELLRIMETEKLFTDPELTIEKLAARLHSNRHFLSQVLNQRLKQSFYDFVNGYRVTEAKNLLCDTEHAHIKISSIAYDAGFNSLSAFNEVFRKFTGMTPSAYRKSRGRGNHLDGKREAESGGI